MQFLLSLLIVTATPAVASDARFPDAVPVYHCLMETADGNYNGWPDGWARHREAGYPQYIRVGIADDRSPAGATSLRIDINGGPVRVDSSSIPIGALFSYVLEGQVKTRGLNTDQAYFALCVYDAKHKLLETFKSAPVSGTQDWTKLRVGPISPATSASYAILQLQVTPAVRPDLRGFVWFDDLWLAQVPRMTLTTNRRHNLYIDPDRPEITCTVSGYLDHEPNVKFELLDQAGKVLVTKDEQLARDAAALANVRQDPVNEKLVGAKKPFAGTTVWIPPINDVGFYRARVTMPSTTGILHQRQLTLGVIRAEPRTRNSEFGWTLPRGEQALLLADLVDLMGECGVSRLKFPVWTAEPARIDQLSWFAERLNTEGVEMIGLLASPPSDAAGAAPVEGQTAAAIFSADPKTWYAALEPVVTRLSLKVRWWQLGLDNDASFVGYPKLAEKIVQVKKQLSRFGQQVNVGVGWQWLNPLPGDASPPWDYLSLGSDPPLTAAELGDYLESTKKCSSRRWAVIEPLAADEYSLDDRAADLVHRLLAAKMHRADGLFVPDVFDPQHGLLNADGSVGELLLPWRTAAKALAGAEYLGRLQLPGGSDNALFVRDHQVVLVIWNAVPQQETVYAADDTLQQVDVWGHARSAQRTGETHTIAVGRVPTFVTGLNEAITRMQLSFAFSQTQLPSVFGRPHANQFTMKNYFSQGVGGHVRLITPDVWRTSPKDSNLKLAAGQTLNQPFEVTLPYDASSGRQKIRIDCEINADRRYTFSVFRHIDIGLDDVTIDVATRLRDDGDVEIEQRLNNQTEELLSFKCQLFVPDRRRMVTQVLDQARGTDKKMYRIPNGADLVGKTLWLRAEEISGQRILNYRFVVEK